MVTNLLKVVESVGAKVYNGKISYLAAAPENNRCQKFF